MAIEVGAVVEGEVTGITNFGAFLQLPEGKVGLIHISAGSYNDMTMKHGYLIHRDNTDMLHHVLQHYSYFAKVNTKMDDPHVRCFGASTLKRENSHE